MQENMQKDWIYLQRKNPMSPNPGYFNISVAFMDLLPKLIPGATAKEWVAVYQNDVCIVYGVKQYSDKLFDVVIKFIFKHPTFIRGVRKKLIEKSEQFLKFCDSLPRNFSDISNKQLWQIYDKYLKDYQTTCVYGDPLAGRLKDKLPEYLLKYLDKIDICYKDKAKDEILGILITDNKLSFTSREELEGFRLVKKIKQNSKWSKIFKLSYKEIKRRLQKNKKLSKLIKRHVARWQWVPYDYGVMLWGDKHFINEFKDKMSLRPKKLNKKIRELETYSQMVEKEQNTIYKLSFIDRFHKQLFESLKDCAFLLDYKKEIFTKSHIAIRSVFEAIANRYGLTYQSVCYLTPKEMKDFLINNKKRPVSEINQRVKFSVLHSLYPGQHKMIEKEEAKKIFNEIQTSIRQQEKGEVAKDKIKGQTAMRGNVKGKVRILLDAREIRKFKKGEVLVTKMTSPDYVSGAKRAIAIVADEGGITCHAAIISRELNIPCIIGTKIATKVLKDGDLVEVDADKGVVKILKRKRNEEKSIFKRNPG